VGMPEIFVFLACCRFFNELAFSQGTARANEPALQVVLDANKHCFRYLLAFGILVFNRRKVRPLIVGFKVRERRPSGNAVLKRFSFVPRGPLPRWRMSRQRWS